MHVFVNWIVNTYAFLAVIPFVPFIFFWFLFYSIFRDKKKSTRLAMDITTLLLVGSVSFMFNKIFASGFGLYLILLFFLLAFGFIGNMQHRKTGSNDFSKIIKIIWRIGFVVLSLVYLVLLFVLASNHILSS